MTTHPQAPAADHARTDVPAASRTSRTALDALDEVEALESLRQPTATRPLRPAAIRVAGVAFTVAIVAALFETAVVVGVRLSVGDPLGPLLPQVGVRLAIFTAVAIATVRMVRGGRIARWVLALGLGVAGLASLLVGPVEWLAAGHTLTSWHPGTTDALFAGSRVVHAVAVVVGVLAMFVPRARAWFARR